MHIAQKPQRDIDTCTSRRCLDVTANSGCVQANSVQSTVFTRPNSNYTTMIDAVHKFESALSDHHERGWDLEART